jgi:hypothetical protein
MTFKFLKIMGIGIILSFSTLANATLIDNGDYSTDTESGLDWLDWTLTIDKTQAEALAVYGSEGYRLATLIETQELLYTLFEHPPTIRNYFNIPRGSPYRSKIKPFAEQFGETYITSFYQASYATLPDHGIFGASPSRIYSGHNPRIYGNDDYKSMTSGIALVKVADVSEPAIITIFVLGFVGIGFTRRRRQS